MDERTDAMIFYGFRYCLGRMTYAVSDCVDYLLQHWEELQPKTKNLILKETQEALDEGSAGMDMDRKQWQKIVERGKS